MANMNENRKKRRELLDFPHREHCQITDISGTSFPFFVCFGEFGAWCSVLDAPYNWNIFLCLSI